MGTLKMTDCTCWRLSVGNLIGRPKARKTKEEMACILRASRRRTAKRQRAAACNKILNVMARNMPYTTVELAALLGMSVANTRARLVELADCGHVQLARFPCYGGRFSFHWRLFK